MKKLAFIPARAGSKRLPGKNTINLKGRPLISYTLDVVLGSLCFDAVVVSTDDSRVRSICNKYVGLHVEDRPPALATDTATVVQVLHQLLTENPCYKNKYEIYGVFLPTTPFRKEIDIKSGLSLLTEDVDSVISVSKCDVPPQYAMRIEGGGILQAVDVLPFITDKIQKQQQEVLYYQIGFFYIGWVASFLRLRSFFQGIMVPYIVPRVQATDIDNSFDLFIAESVLDCSKWG